MMRKVETMSIKEFMNRKDEVKIFRINKNVYKVVLITGLTAIVFLSGFDLAFADDGSIDKTARHLYDKLLSIGKWFIVAKGAIDTINDVIKGDLGAAKKNFLGYLVVYVILHGLPWAMDEVDLLFHEATQTIK